MTAPLQTVLPHPREALQIFAYGIHVWRKADGSPDVWKHVPTDAATKTPAHYVQFPSISDIPDKTARERVQALWTEIEGWRKDYQRSTP